MDDVSCPDPSSDYSVELKNIVLQLQQKHGQKIAKGHKEGDWDIRNTLLHGRGPFESLITVGKQLLMNLVGCALVSFA